MSSTPLTANVNLAARTESQRSAALTALGFLILRVAVGLVFALHGWQKLTGMGVDGVGGFFGSLGVPAPALLALVVTAVELIGGIALILGVGTRIAGALLALDMAGALLLVHVGNGFFVDAGGFEFVLTLGAAALFLALAGPGAWSVDGWWSKRK